MAAKASMLVDLMTRLGKLERRQTTRRVAVVTGTDPLTVEMTPPATPYSNVRSVGPEVLSIGQSVLVDLWGTDLVVLGSLQGGAGAPGSITGDSLAQGSVLGGEHIVTSSVSSDEMTEGTITAESAILADEAVGGSKIAAGAIDGKVITGALIRTAAAGERVELSGTTPIGLKKYDAAGNVAVAIGQANGLEILAGISATPPADRRVSWKRAAGTKVADLVGFDDGVGQSALYASVTNTAGLSWSRYILREDGKSGFLQIPAPKQAAVLWGRMGNNGAVIDAGSGSWGAAADTDSQGRAAVNIFVSETLDMTGMCPQISLIDPSNIQLTIITKMFDYVSAGVRFRGFQVVIAYDGNLSSALRLPFSFTVLGLTSIAGAVT